MIFTLVAWIYITLVCRMWGELTSGVIRKIAGGRESASLDFAIYCFLGLAGISVCFTLLSLFMPLDGFPAQLILLAPCIALITRKSYRASLFINPVSLAPIFMLLLIIFLMLVLVMSSWYVTNEDTLGYHAQVIQWIEKFRAVPGIVHLHVRYGIQSSWFIDSAIFSFKFLGSPGLTFINSTVLAWFLLFVTGQANRWYHQQGQRAKALLWMALLLGSFGSYTLIRLTATSASPDFAGAVYTWLIFYLLISTKRKEQSPPYLVLLIVLGFFAMTVKLSALPAAIIAIYGACRLVTMKKIRALIICILPVILIMLPFVARNIISSGYAFFPSVYPDIANVDWKMNDDVGTWAKYVTTYARTRSGATTEEINEAIRLPASKWIPVWWKNQSVADQAIVILALLGLLLTIVRFTKLLKKDESLKIAMVTAVTGCVFWFIKAPDPRFGFGFLVPLIGIAALLYIPEVKKPLPRLQMAIAIIVLMIAIGVGGYTVYRIKNFFTASQIIAPMGISNGEYQTISCNDIDIQVPKKLYGCGDINAPCAYDDCRTFEPRGKTIMEGFRLRADR